MSGLCPYSPWCMDTTVEDRCGGFGTTPVLEGGQKDQFPTGMRVLAVDDDPVCLKLLEVLLRRCRYNVTTTNQAITALKMLREDRDKFDLVISDVHMPDMDGFKLLELVGLEMDLPVIMMSVNGETRTVMKGITHGACDYLVKPVRIEELRNIWQHVVRRRKFDCGDYYNYDNREDPGKLQIANGESEKVQYIEGSSDHSEKLSGKRKDQDEEDEDNSGEHLHENEDISTQKKPRVVWSMDLHRKFVDAVNHLGIDNAVPKRILEHMNVEKLNRENVASHLQKYRLYLKRLSSVSRQTDLLAAFGGGDLSYLHMGSSDGHVNFQELDALAQMSSLTSFQPGGALRRPNSTAPRFQNLALSGLIQAGGTCTNSCFPLISNIQQIDELGSQQGNLIQGIPTSLEFEQFLPNRTQDAKRHLPSGFSSDVLHAGDPNNTFLDMTDGSLMSQAHKQQRDSSDSSGYSSTKISFMCLDPRQVSTRNSCHLPALGRCNDPWQSGVSEPGYMAKALSTASSANHADAPKISANAHVSHRLSLSNLSSSTMVASQLDPFISRDVECQDNYSNRPGMLLPRNSVWDSRHFSFSNGAVTEADPICNAEKPNQNNLLEHELQYSSVTGPTLSSNYMLSSCTCHQRTNGRHHNSTLDKSIISGTDTSTSLLMARPNIDKTTANSQLNYKDKYILEVPKVKGAVSNGCMLDDGVGSMIISERDDILLMDDGLGLDFYPLGACM